MRINKNVFNVLKERWKYYLVGYIIGSMISFANTGIPNYIYLNPIKLFPTLMAILIGTAFYYGGVLKLQVFQMTFRLMKYVIISGIMIIVFGIFSLYLESNGVDIKPFIGM